MKIQTSENIGARPIVMLVGTFHFAEPKKDVVKNKTKDVTGNESQAYLEDLARRIANYSPTAILLEYDQKEDEKVNERYAQYRAGKCRLSANEIEQIGFRVAKLIGLNRVHSFDEREVPWKAQNLFEQLKHETELEKRFNESISEMTEDEERAHSSLSLRELLIKYNSSEMDCKNKSLYLVTNAAGVNENFAGAEAAASWWHRNFRMFARIQKFSQAGERVLVIGGQGHMAVIRDFLKLDSHIGSEEVMPYL